MTLKSNFKNKTLLALSFASCLFFANSLSASGFRLAEQSLNGTALNSAFVAGAYGADSSYYNPANMGFGEDSDKFEIELGATFIYVPSFNFTKIGGDVDQGVAMEFAPNIPTLTYDKNSKSYGRANATYSLVPKLFIKSNAYELGGDFKLNYGLSITTPQGLDMDWDGEGGGFMDDLSIAIVDINPVISLTYRDFLSVAVGGSALYSWGNFNNTLNVPFETNFLGIINVKGTTNVTQTSDAKGWGGGYNLALSYKPTQSTTISTTYRSKRALNLKGEVAAFSRVGTLGTVKMNSDLALDADMPAIFNIAIAQDFGRFRAEFVYERTFWKNANIFNFNQSNAQFSEATGLLALAGDNIAGMMNAADYNAVYYGQGWRDSNAYRLGLSYLGEDYKLMGSFAYDETPAPQGRFGIPDASAYMLGFGLRKNFSKNVDIGLAYSLSIKDNRRSFIKSHSGKGQLHLISTAIRYIF